MNLQDLADEFDYPYVSLGVAAALSVNIVYAETISELTTQLTII